MNNDIKQFVEKIIEEAGLSNMPEEFKEEYKQKMVLEAEKRMGVVTLKHLNESQAKELAQITENNPDDIDKVNDFLEKSIENYKEIMTEALREFAQDVISAAQKIS